MEDLLRTARAKDRTLKVVTPIGHINDKQSWKEIHVKILRTAFGGESNV